MRSRSRKAVRPVVGVGLCVVDELVLLEGDGGPGAERTRYRERTVSPGGMVATALVQAARLGCRAQILSMVGDDDEGRTLARSLRDAGVGTRRLLRQRGQRTSVAVVLVDARSGERRFLVPDRRALERRTPRFDLSPIRSGAVVLVDGHFAAQALRAVRLARSVGAIVVGDFSDSRPAYHRLLPYVDYPIVPASFGESWAGLSPRDTLLALREEYGGRPVVTQGKRGALFLDGRRARRVPAPRVEVVDTTGAGDVFHGAFAAGLAHGRSEEASLAWAVRAAAQSCTALGGPTRLMSLHQMVRAA